MEWNSYQEGAVEFQLPVTNRVFYNPRARLSRDLAVLAARVEAERLERPLHVLELMSGIGLRTRRLLTESPIELLLANDANMDAFEILQSNLKDDPRVELRNDLAQRLLAKLYLEDRRFDWVDIDPFGTPAPYFPWVQGVCKWEGLIYATATDAPVLCGAQRLESLKSYDAVAYYGRECHEFGLRILIGFLQRRLIQANMHGVPLFSVFDGYSWRSLMRVHKGTRNYNPESQGFIAQLPSGEYRTARSGIPVPSAKEGDWYETVRWIGPLWLGHLHDRDFVTAMFRAADEEYFKATRRFLTRVLLEADDLPVVYDLSEIADRMGREVPPRQLVLSRLRALGHRASEVHHNGRAIRVDAPFADILKAWDEPSGILEP